MRLTDESFEFDDSGNSARMDLVSCSCSRRVTTVISKGMHLLLVFRHPANNFKHKKF